MSMIKLFIRIILQVRAIRALPSGRTRGNNFTNFLNVLFDRIKFFLKQQRQKKIDLLSVRPEGSSLAAYLKGQSLLLFFLFFSFPIHPFFSFFSRPSARNATHENENTQNKMPLPQRTIIIMIDPAGDAQNAGRKIDDNFERSLTLQYAEHLKKIVEEEFPRVRVILTRESGQVIVPLQNANFANRLDVALYLSINFYQETETKPRLYLYNFSYSDDFIIKKEDLSFCAYDQAYLYNYRTTREYGNLMHDILDSSNYKNIFECKKCSKLPFKPLIGIKSPALAIEAGLMEKDSWNSYINPLIESLRPIIEKLQSS
jgi:N-acetylmuramoyl-L-alanine amidase